jgi:DNA-binding winged helix-turn-helix (wHTH) protein
MIIENVWSDIKDGNFVMDQTIAANISRLRKVLNGNAPDSEYIETIKGKTRSEAGYRLVPQGFDKTSG